MPPAKDESLKEANCLDIINISEKSPAKNSALVDVRACNKPASKVRIYIFSSVNYLGLVIGFFMLIVLIFQCRFLSVYFLFVPEQPMR